jgi:hypothetical protein
VHVDLAPVLDLADGPLGARQYRSPFYGVAFGRGLVAGGRILREALSGLGTLASPLTNARMCAVRSVTRISRPIALRSRPTSRA